MEFIRIYGETILFLHFLILLFLRNISVRKQSGLLKAGAPALSSHDDESSSQVVEKHEVISFVN